MSVRFFISKNLTEDQEERLRGAGIEPLGLPLIKTLPVEFDPSKALSFNPDFVVFSSKNGVKFFFNRVEPKDLKGTGIVAVGSATSKELLKLGFSPTIPKNFSAEGLIDLLKSWELEGKRFLIVRPKKARGLLKEFLKEMGAEVLELVVYQTVKNRDFVAEISEFFSKGVDYCAFTSPSNFKAFLELIPGGRDFLRRAKLIPIGHVTQRAIEEEGYLSLNPPSSYTVDGILELLIDLASSC